MGQTEELLSGHYSDRVVICKMMATSFPTTLTSTCYNMTLNSCEIVVFPQILYRTAHLILLTFTTLTTMFLH